MPTSKKSKTFAMRVPAKRILEEKWNSELEEDGDTNIDFGGYINDLLDYIILKDEFAKVHFPNLSYDDVKGDTFKVRDMFLQGKVVEVELQKDKFYCKHHQSNSCEHIHYALCSIKLARMRTLSRYRLIFEQAKAEPDQEDMIENRQ